MRLIESNKLRLDTDELSEAGSAIDPNNRPATTRGPSPAAPKPHCKSGFPTTSLRQPNTGQRLPFRAVFFTDREYTAEYSSGLLHAALHVGWVQEQKTDRYRGQLAVYVKHRNHYGPLYMTAIAPFRHHIVCPTILKRLGRT